MPGPGSVEKSELNLRVEVASGEDLDVRNFSVSEGMSKLFGVELLVMSGSTELDFDEIVGCPASFSIHGSAHPRTWTGICSAMQQLGAEEQGQSTYQMTIVPTLWLLTQRRNYKMFQQKSELDIVKEVLGEWGITPLEKLSGTYKKRKYRVQYAESDYAFVSRMLEDAGISFYFIEHRGDKKKGPETKLVLSDAPHLDEPRAERLRFHGDVSMVSGEYVTNVRLAQQVRPGRYAMRDHDYRRPPNYKLLASAEAGSGGIEQQLERYHYTPGAFLFGATKGDGSPVADDKGRARTDEGEAALVAQRRLEAKRVNAKVFAFETNAMDLHPGVVMRMKGHSRAKLNAERLLVVEATYSGTSHGRWAMQCEARSAEVPYRPSLVTPKPKVTGVESATVVGPAGDEIHTDEFGRVRVHFHWDRESKMDDSSSCWIHVSQPWAGAGYGGTNLPRIGHEVLVDFLGGDPDRPVIVGRVYTNLQKTPYKLPENKTQSGWKSNSTGGSGGYNEIMFEDAGGKELVRMQAQKDLKKLVKNDEQVTIGHDRSKVVGHDDSLMVGHDRSRIVANDETITIGQNQTLTVGANQTITLPSGNQTETIKGNRTFTLTGNLDETITGNSTLTQVGNQTEVLVGDSSLTQVGGQIEVLTGSASLVHTGNRTTVQTGDLSSAQVGNRTETLTGDFTLTHQGDHLTSHTGNRMELIVGNATVMQSGERTDVLFGNEIKLQLGNHSETRVGNASTLQVGERSDKVVGNSNVATTGQLKITGAATINVEAGGITTIKGSIIKLNC